MSIAEALPQNLSIAPAGIEDFDAVADVMARANAHSVEKSGGTSQWLRIDFVHDQIRHHLNAGEMYVARGMNNRILGCIALTEQDNMWPDQATSNALYFHKLMKNPDAAGESARMATHLLRFAAQEALILGKSAVRCDVKSELPNLVRYYTDYFGFEPRGTAVYGSTQLEATLLETSPGALLALCNTTTTHSTGTTGTVA